MLPFINKYLLNKYVIIGILFIRFVFDLCGEWIPGNAFPYELVSPINKKWYLYINPDDKEISRTAFYWLEGKGFITNESFDRPQYNKPSYRKAQTWPTALRNRYNIIYHAGLIKTYRFVYGNVQLNDQYNLPSSYFSFNSFLFFIIKWVLTLVSFYYLFACGKLFFSNKMSFLFLSIWALYPSNFYIFPINMWDTLAAPLCTIIISKFILECTKEKIATKQYVILGVLTSLTFTFKFHVLLTFLTIYLLLFCYGIIKRKKVLIYISSFVSLFHLIVFIPLWLSTYNTFGHPLFSTQSGVNLMHAHNPAARGSWTPLVWDQHRDVLTPLLNNPNIQSAKNEYDEAQAYKKVALGWAFSHPKEEIELSARKFAIYFLPHNYESWKWNPGNLLIHTGFLLFSLLMLKNPRKFDIKYWILFFTCWSMVAVNVIYFVEYRWRYYVEPQMILCTLVAFYYLYKLQRVKLKAHHYFS